MSQSIKIKDVGAIRIADIPFAPEGGVIELRGAQGVGKSTALRAIENLATGKGKLPVRDRAKVATIEGLGMIIKVGARTTRTGEPEIVSLEGKFSISDLVDPGIANADAADAKRIKALIQLAGVKAEIAFFEECLVLDGAENLSPETVEADDLLVMAERVKRDIESRARKIEDKAENARGKAQALREAAGSAEGLPEAGITADDAQRMLEASIAEHAAVKQRADSARHRARAGERAKAQLETAVKEYRGMTAEAAQAAAESTLKQVDARQHIVSDLRAELRDAQEELRLAKERHDAAEVQLIAAVGHAETTAAWEAAINEADDIYDPESHRAAIAQAEEIREECRNLVAKVAIRDKMAKQLADAQRQGDVARQAAEQAAMLRDAARNVDHVLSAAVADLGTKLYVEAGRLIFDTARGPTFFSELSDGERARIVIEIAIDQAAKLADAERLGIFVIPQQMWSELQPANREWTRARCQERRVLAYAAVATDDPELTAEIL